MQLKSHAHINAHQQAWSTHMGSSVTGFSETKTITRHHASSDAECCNSKTIHAWAQQGTCHVYNCLGDGNHHGSTALQPRGVCNFMLAQAAEVIVFLATLNTLLQIKLHNMP